MDKSITVACVQAAPVFMDLEGTIDKTIDLIKEAASRGAELIAFPENWLPGYPWFLWLDSPAALTPLVYQYYQNSLVLGSEQAKRIASVAKENNIWLLLGLSERDHGTLYMAQWFISNTGETVGVRRKLKPSHVERTLFGESDGSSLKTFTTELGVIGALCCWEHIQPLTRYVMYAQHEQIHIASWPSFSLYRDITAALSPEVNIALSRSYAVEGQCFVIAPCAIVSEQIIEQLCTDETKQNLLKAGGGYARIFGPDGSELTTPLAENEEGLLLATLEPAAITFAKAIADPVGHYSRPDVTCLLFNPAANRPLSIKTASFIELIDTKQIVLPGSEEVQAN